MQPGSRQKTKGKSGRSSQPRRTWSIAPAVTFLAGSMLAFAGCSGGGHSGSASSNYTIGGTISGLTAGSVVLLNGDSTVSVSSSETTWVFPGSFAANSSYAVTVESQPVSEVCVVDGGSGASLTANLSNIAVTCSAFGQWIWEAGFNTVNGSGIYGTQGITSANSVPGARYQSSSWTDSSGNLWLFGGSGYDSSGSGGYLNDLWQYSPNIGQWTWMGGGSLINASPVYGVQGTASNSNVPGARFQASSWTDASGNLWLFGGYGYDSTGSVGYLNDLWRYTPSSGQWTWISGSSAENAIGTYGSQGIAASANVPGARYSASSWMDSSGNLWLFGGYGYDSAGGAGRLNDLWRYSLNSGQWTWISGANIDNASAVYGTQDTASASNVPGARQAASSWIDSAGSLWLLGGYGYSSTSSVGYLNDLWRYIPSTGQWTWLSGGSADNAAGVCANQGKAAVGNVPGARQAANSWIDSSGNLLLFGGTGYDSSGNVGYLDDLWQFSPSTELWTCISGNGAINGNGSYSSQGSSAGGSPGAREGANGWIDSSDHLWLFGGVGYGSSASGYLNDLWKYVPP